MSPNTRSTGTSCPQGVQRSPKMSLRRSPRRSLIKPTHTLTSPETNRQRGSPITFGIEIEAALAFHESMLQKVLEKYYKSVPVIVKQLNLDSHYAFVGTPERSHNCRELYPSWVLEVPNDYEKDKSLSLMQDRAHTDLTRADKLRPYLAEPLIIAKELLGKKELPVDVRAEIIPVTFSGSNRDPVLLGNDENTQQIMLKSPNPNYENWTLTTDRSLIGLLNSQLEDRLGHETTTQTVDKSQPIDTQPIERNWDSAGIELISPVFQVAEKTTAYTKIGKYLAALKRGPTWKLSSSKWAALQVHIGLDFDGTDVRTLRILQHLAYILICHEDLISKVHPRSRCGLPIKRHIDPTDEPTLPLSLPSEDLPGDELLDEDFLEETPPPLPSMEEIETENETNVLKLEAELTGYEEIKSNRRFFLHNLGRDGSDPPSHLAAIRAKIFDPSLGIPDLVALIQKPNRRQPQYVHRGYMYNFANIAGMFTGSSWKTPKPTIEFRQHECSIKPDEIQYWVEFCFALVKCAERMADCETGWDGERLESIGAGRQFSQDETDPVEQNIFAEREGRKYTSSQDGSWSFDSITKFCGPGFLNLDDEAISYWQARYERFKDDRPAPHEIDESTHSHSTEFRS